MAAGYQALKTVLIGDVSSQTLQNLSDLIHIAYMAKMVAEIKKSPTAVEPKQMKVLRQKLRVELRGILQIPETTLEKELNYVKEQNEALIAALLASYILSNSSYRCEPAKPNLSKQLFFPLMKPADSPSAAPIIPP